MQFHHPVPGHYQLDLSCLRSGALTRYVDKSFFLMELYIMCGVTDHYPEVVGGVLYWDWEGWRDAV